MFVNQLNKLEKQLDQCNCSFVRCIKPNDENISDSFDYEKIHDQLLYSGVIEGIKLVLKGYPVKIKIDSLDNEFKYIYGSNIDINQVLDKNNIQENKYSFGKSKIFMKRDVYDLLTEEDFNIQNLLAGKITRFIRTWFYRQKFIMTKNSVIKLQAFFRMIVLRNKFNKYIANNRATIIQSYIRRYIACKYYKKVINSIRIIQYSFKVYSAKKLYNKKLSLLKRRVYAANLIKKYYIEYVDRKRLRLENDIKFQNDKLLEALKKAEDDKLSKQKLLKIELDKKDKELEILKKELETNIVVNNMEIENKYKNELDKKDKELAELRSKLHLKSNKLTDSVNENYIINNQDKDGLYEIDLNSNYECDNAVQMVGKKLENMYLELNTRDEMMNKLSNKYKKLEKLYKMEQSKKTPKTLWEKISSLF